MMLRNTTTRWGSVTRIMHWGSAIIIGTMFILGIVMINIPLSPLRLELFIWHKAIGITLLALAILRVVWRWSSIIPNLPEDLSHRAVQLARAGHYWLYVLLIAMPLSGWVINSAANFPLNWFGVFEVPPLVKPNPRLEDLAKDSHLVLAILLGLTVIAHILVALYHHKVRRDDVLRRML